MTDEARKKGIEIGAGLLIYLIAWSIVSYWTVSSMGETVLFFGSICSFVADYVFGPDQED